MIIVCEPQCKGISHENVNCGYIYGLLLAYPKEKIVFFADKSHHKEIISILKSDKINIDRIKLIPIEFNSNKSFSISGILNYYLLFSKIFDKTLIHKSNKVFFLSTNPIILLTIKLLKSMKKYNDICCTFVLHGEFEDIANIKYIEPYVPNIEDKYVKNINVNKFNEFLKHLIKIPSIISDKINSFFTKLSLVYSLIFKKTFRTKKMMMWKHSKQYKYISMSPHVTENAKKYLDVNYLNIHTIILPIIFAKPTLVPNNKYIKFAVFGYGDSAQMYKMLTLLSKKKISKPYEIRIISMDSRGTEGFSNIRVLSQGKVLTRKEMAKASLDIDMFINLYNKTRHKLGCSLSILESFSYLKPVLHLSNPGYNYFNKSNMPIGYRTESLSDFVNKLCDMIENYERYKEELKMFKNNILRYREEYTIENNLNSLRESFTF